MPKTRICYCRFFSSSVGLKVPAESLRAARAHFARLMGVPETSSYIVASFKPAPGILFTDIPTEGPMPFSPRVPCKKPVITLTEIPGECYGPDSLVLNGDTYNRYPYLFEFRFAKSGGCKLFIRGDRTAIASAGGYGYGYDKKGVCMAQWFTKTFAAELKAIFDQPKYAKQLDGSSMGQRKDGTAHPWYCVYRDAKTGHININGMSGLDNVVEIMERSVGLTLRYIGETNDSTLYLLAKHVPRKR